MVRAFNIAPARVKPLLDGAVLVVKRPDQEPLIGVLLSVIPRDTDHCAKFRAKGLPCFREGIRPGAAVHLWRGTQAMLFVSTGDYSCVEIHEVELAGEQIKSSIQVCEDLGLTEQAAFNAEWDGTVLTLSPE